jgi:hypothetical protein
VFKVTERDLKVTLKSVESDSSVTVCHLIRDSRLQEGFETSFHFLSILSFKFFAPSEQPL